MRTADFSVMCNNESLTSMEESITTFISYFRDQVENIRDDYNILHRKILFALIIDPLSRAAYGTEGTHRERVTKLIIDHSFWDDCSRVSLPQLVLNLEDRNLQETDLYHGASDRLSKWPSKNIPRLNQSPLFDELESFTSADTVDVLKKCRYVELFYTFRNNLIHEFREPGYGIEMSQDGTTPYYHGMKDNPWQLVYPIGFFKRLCESILDSLPSHFRNNNITPHDQFEFGSLWRAR